MLKRILFLTMALLMLVSCGDEEQANTTEKAPAKTEEQAKEERAKTTGIEDEKFNDAVTAAIFAYNKGVYRTGEVQGEGHKVCAQKEVDGKIYVYTYVRYGEFKMMDGAMCKIDGSGAVPTLLIFDKDLKFIEAKEPSYANAEEYETTTAELFPAEILDLFAAFHDDPQGYLDLSTQEASYVEMYMQEKGIEAVIKQ